MVTRQEKQTRKVSHHSQPPCLCLTYSFSDLLETLTNCKENIEGCGTPLTGSSSQEIGSQQILNEVAGCKAAAENFIAGSLCLRKSLFIAFCSRVEKLLEEGPRIWSMPVPGDNERVQCGAIEGKICKSSEESNDVRLFSSNSYFFWRNADCQSLVIELRRYQGRRVVSQQCKLANKLRWGISSGEVVSLLLLFQSFPKYLILN